MMTIRSIAAVAALATANVAFAGVTMTNNGAPGTAWPTSPDGSAAPAVQTTANPSSGTVAQTVAPNAVEAHTFTVASSLKVGALAWTFSGSAPGNYGIHLFPFKASSVYTPASGGYVPASDLDADLLSGGASVAYSGSNSSNVIFFDLSGSDEVTLAAGQYAFEIWNLGSNTGNIFPMRAGETYAGGSIYQSAADPNALSGTSSVGRNNVAGGTRDGIFAVYTVAPEPASMLAVASVGVTVLRRRRRPC